MADWPSAHWAADLVLVVHSAFVLFVVGGQILILIGWWRHWQWPRRSLFRWLHLIAIGVVVIEAWVGWACPLTALEDALRGGSGGAIYGDAGFIAHWLRWLVFWRAPPWVFTAIYTAFALLVLFSFWGYPPRPGTQSRRSTAQ
ncbi:MAG: hypothetical protein A2V91_04145 [Candidatus Muproteobacteria bacterium RBG_16_64_10]|uniref:DUF2784 domain-containing protein n=1 Tax=Candidatus Muproteobacteria bacterium RBG_16_64_10 TaxID=1817757 RepID=A0A1F6SXJ5_9PROT|nr:MAG: hypothetical protein A2V91_04145 [Candidatus Muproteobacteria bacterium RBG_16_64_10]